MKRISKHLLTFLLSAVMAASGALSPAAATVPRLIGDADSDSRVSIMDASRIQRRLAGLSKMSRLESFLADVNGNGNTDIIDATLIQRYLVGLYAFYDADVPGGGYYGYDIEDYRFYADYDSGRARVGAPVTFRAEAIAVDSPAYGNPQDPMTYAFYVNDVPVQERSEKNELTYVFCQAGDYRIRVEMYNAFGEMRSAELSPYRVVEPYALDRPVIVSTLFKDDTCNSAGYSPLYLRAEGGVGPYRFMVTAVGRYKGCEEDGFFIEEPIDEYSPVVISTGYTVGEVYQLPRGLYRKSSPIPEEEAAATITVYAKDSRGNISEPVTVYHQLSGRTGQSSTVPAE